MFDVSDLRKGDAMPTTVAVDPGGLTATDVHRRVEREHTQIHACWQKRLAEKPALGNKLVARFLIDGNGKVVQADATGLDDPTVEKCVADVIRGIGFKKSEEGTPTNVTAYPFTFSKEGVK